LIQFICAHLLTKFIPSKVVYDWVNTESWNINSTGNAA